MLGISDAVELTRKVADLVKAGATIGLQETVMELREAVMNAKDEVLTLRAELQAFKAKELEAGSWKDTEARYPLVKAPGGGMVRQAAGPPEHYVCPKCFEDRKIYPLQSRRVASGEYTCPGCGKGFPVAAPVKTQQVAYGTRENWVNRW